MKNQWLKVIVWSFLMLAGLVSAQTPPAPAPTPAPTPPKNLVPNGGFERVITFQNLYDGVDASGNLRVFRASSPVFLEGSTISSIPFAATVNFVDVNSDGTPDLVIGSPLGFCYWYPNTGKKGEPVFQRGNLVPTYLGPGSRVSAVDFRGGGRMDVLFGNLYGGLHVLANNGGGEPRWTSAQGNPRWFPPVADPKLAADPRYVQKGFEVANVNFSNNEPINVGNYSAPCYADWNKDGLPDLIVGEGSYSANSVRIWLNTGSKSKPVFSKENSFYIAFGEGKEQLTPFVYDLNGDGIPDLITGDRDGRISLFLGTDQAIKNSKQVDPVEFTKYITIGGREKVGSLISPIVCDWNGDGIPDIMYGTTSGQVYIALGSGKREDPEFGAATQIKGTDTEKDFKQPSAWENPFMGNAIDNGSVWDVSAPMPQVVSLDENPGIEVKEGKRAFHLYWFDKFYGWHHRPNLTTTEIFKSLSDWVEGMYTLRNTTLPFVLGKDYEFSFWHKGENMKIFYTIDYTEDIRSKNNPKGPPLVNSKNQRLGMHTPLADTVSVGALWNQYRKTIRLAGTREKSKDGEEVDTSGKRHDDGAVLTLYIVGKGDLWLDDMKLIEVVKTN